MYLSRTALPLIVSLVTLGAAKPAAADEPSTAIVHGVLAGELTTAGVFALNFGTKLLPNHGPALAVDFAPMVIAPLAAYGAYRADLDPTPALAIHGAAWLGTDLFLLGTLIDGRDKAWGVHVGTAAWTLGALGTIAGGVIGATQVDGRDEATAWMLAPPLGFAAGGLVLGGILVLAGGLDGDNAAGQFTTGALVGLSLGLGVSGYLAYRGFGDTAPNGTAMRLTSRLDPSPGRVLFSFGGAF